MSRQREVDEQELWQIQEHTEAEKEIPRGWRPSQKTIEAIQETGESSTSNRDSLTQGDALAAVQAGIDEHRDHYIKAQGRAAERVALREMESDGQLRDLNAGGAANFPIYDVTSDKRVASVKCRGLSDDGTLDDVARDAYVRDFEEAIGRGPDAVKFREAAQHLHERARTEGAGYPPEVASSPEAADAYLRSQAELWLPADHAIAVRNTLERRLLGGDPLEQEVTASRLGLDPRSPDYESDVQATLARIHGMGIFSAEIKTLLNRAFE
jgi:hypothetical protein